MLANDVSGNCVDEDGEALLDPVLGSELARLSTVGRVGGGQELGGLRALRFHHQFCALQEPAGWLGPQGDQAAHFPG